MSSSVTRFVDEVPEYAIKDGIVHVIVGGDELCFASLKTFRVATAAATRCLAEHDARSADVLPIKGRRGRHAATS